MLLDFLLWGFLYFLSGFREKKFAIIGVKVYAAGLYVNESILTGLTAWKGKSADEIQRDSSLFSSIFQGNELMIC